MQISTLWCFLASFWGQKDTLVPLFFIWGNYPSPSGSTPLTLIIIIMIRQFIRRHNMSMIERSCFRLPAGAPLGNNSGKLFTPMCLCHQAAQFGTGQRVVMLCGREGNSRFGVALAMRHRLQWFIHLRAQRLWEGDEHPTYAPEGQGRLYLFYVIGYIYLKPG